MPWCRIMRTAVLSGLSRKNVPETSCIDVKTMADKEELEEG